MFSFSAPAGFVVIMIVNLSLLGWLQRRARESCAQLKGDRHVIRYSGALRSCVVGYAILLAVFWTYAFLMVSRMKGPYAATPEGLLIFVAIFAFILFAPALLHVFGSRIEYDSTHVHTFSPWGADRTVLWSDIAGYSFGRILKQHIFSIKGGNEIRFGVLLSGHQSLLDEARGRGIPGLQ